MRKQIVYISVLTILLFNVSFCESQQMRQGYRQDGSTEIDGERFALDLLQRIVGHPDAASSNVIFSPWSIRALLLMLFEGANGNTAYELMKALNMSTQINNARSRHGEELLALDSARSSSIDLLQASGVFVDNKRQLFDSYKNNVNNYYRAEVRPVDFTNPRTAHDIDSYIASATNGRISEVIHYNDIKNAELILLNAVYFKGSWKYPFNGSATHTDKFYDDRNRPIADVTMMHVMAPFTFSLVPSIEARAISLPYGNEEKLSMVVIVPYGNTTVNNVINQLSITGMSPVYRAFERAKLMFEGDDVVLYLPRFKTLSDLELNSIMSQMGINDVFDPARADLSRMSSSALFLATVLHKAEIEVNEEGTVASAATIGQVINKSHPPKLYVNRPFIYFIIENETKTILFAGKFSNPRSN